MPAHSNMQEDGKGRGQKADDCFVAASCQHCHDVLDGRTRIRPFESATYYIPAEELVWYHNRGIKRTIRRLFDMGVIKV